jgi:hypothetical protein
MGRSVTVEAAVEPPNQVTAYPHLRRGQSSLTLPFAGLTLLLLFNLTILCNTRTLTRRIPDMPPIILLPTRRPRACPKPNGTVPTRGREYVAERVVCERPDDLVMGFLYHRYGFRGFRGGKVPVADGAVVASACQETVVYGMPGECCEGVGRCCEVLSRTYQ